MKVGFDAHMVGQRETGNETYALGLLAGLDEIGFGVESYSLTALPASAHHNQHRVWPGSPWLRVPLIMPALAARDGLDLYHGTYVLPPLLPCKGVVTVHDITFALHPEWFSAAVWRILSVLVPHSLKKASHVIAISENTKHDLVERYRLPPEKISVTHLAPRPVFAGPPQRRPDVGRPFFLYVGNLEPRKNLETLVRALAVLRDRRIEIPLVVAGQPGLNFPALLDLVGALNLRALVDFKGYVSDNELLALYSRCLALVHPALYEGFGLTPLEAMAQGVPVIASSTSSLPEVVGDAALLIGPHQAEGWAQAMEAVATSSQIRQELCEKGQKRARQFSWKRCASQTVAAYRSIL